MAGDRSSVLLVSELCTDSEPNVRNVSESMTYDTSTVIHGSRTMAAYFSNVKRVSENVTDDK